MTSGCYKEHEETAAATSNLVVVQRSAVRPDEIVAFLAGSLARHMLPRYVEFVSEMPKTPTQQVQRFKLAGLTRAVYDLKHAAAMP